MRELRDFELDEKGVPVGWRVPPGQTLVANRGHLWLTVEGHARDIWLLPGMAVALPAGRRVWLSDESPAGDGTAAAFTLVQQHHPLSWRVGIVRLLGWRRASETESGMAAFARLCTVAGEPVSPRAASAG